MKFKVKRKVIFISESSVYQILHPVNNVSKNKSRDEYMNIKGAKNETIYSMHLCVTKNFVLPILIWKTYDIAKRRCIENTMANESPKINIRPVY